MTNTIFGSGLSFPIRIGRDGRLAWSHEEDNVRESLRVLLTTAPGERVMREEYGCGLRRYLAEPQTPTTRQLIERCVLASIARWEPRVTVQEVAVEPDPDEERRVRLTIVYELNASGSLASLNLSLKQEG